MFQYDWGGEFQKLTNHFKKTSIKHQIACPHTHQQMGAIEQRHEQIFVVGLSLLFHSHIPQQF